jgi:hypothetical protein
VRVVDLLFAVLALDIHVDHARLQRAGAIKREHGDDVFEAVRLEPRQQLTHALGFELEDTERVAALEKVVGRRILEADLGPVDRDAVLLAHHRLGFFEDRQRLEAQEVHLEHADVFEVGHLPLRRDVVAVAIQRHELVERLVGEHDARGVGGCVAAETFEAHADVEERLVHLIRLAHLLQLGVRLDGFTQRCAGAIGHLLRDLVDLGERDLHRATDVADHTTRSHRAEGDDLRDVLDPVFVTHVFDD